MAQAGNNLGLAHQALDRAGEAAGFVPAGPGSRLRQLQAELNLGLLLVARGDSRAAADHLAPQVKGAWHCWPTFLGHRRGGAAVICRSRSISSSTPVDCARSRNRLYSTCAHVLDREHPVCRRRIGASGSRPEPAGAKAEVLWTRDRETLNEVR